MPTPPQPITATVSPGATFAVWIAAPKPVMTPQPIRAARSSGMSSRIFTTAFSCTSICSANDDRLAKLCSCSGRSHSRRLDTPGGSFTSVLVQIAGRPVVQFSQVPQNTDRQVTTWSPRFTWVTSEPTCSTMPADSWPSTTGSGCG